MISKSNLLNILAITHTLKVLYVEDNSESRIQALKMFHNYFDYIDVAVDGSDGLNCYENYFFNTNEFYDLVITDIAMPNMDGINMSKAIYGLNKEQKILVVSAYSDKKYFIDLINMGVEGFIQKPLSFEQVSDALKQVCRSFVDTSIITLSFNCSYNKLSKKLSLEKEEISLTKNENKFIEFLIKNRNLNSTLEDIFNHIFYDNPDKEFTTDSIKGLIKRVRKKLPEGLILHNRTTGYSINLN